MTAQGIGISQLRAAIKKMPREKKELLAISILAIQSKKKIKIQLNLTMENAPEPIQGNCKYGGDDHAERDDDTSDAA